MEDDEFRRGDIDIQWLERRLPGLLATKPPGSLVRDVAIVAALIADRDRARLRRRPSQESAAGTADREGAESAWHRAARLDALR